ncbi:MAG: sulfatase-like hydrolase/transferase [Bacteroidota bacterium]
MKPNIFVFSILSTLSLLSCQQDAPPPPNILFILADDLGYHDLSVMGSEYYETPNIDRIAQEGMIFTQGYAASRVCSPSRASIMSGKFTVRHGITDWIGAKTGEAWREKERFNKLLPPEYVLALDSNYLTMPEALKRVGYKTFFAGKWHIGAEGSYPEDHGFDINVGGWEKGSPIGGFFSPWNNPKLENQAAGENLSMRLAKETSQFIEAHQDTSFFAFLSFYAVHAPLETTREKWAKYRDKATAMGVAEKGYEMGHFLPIRQNQDHPIYGGLVETMDDAVGQVLKTIDELGLAENTIVIFTSDNGGVAAGDAFATSNAPLRAGKGYQFEGGIREPFFIKVPKMGNGKRNETPVIGTDFYPTLLELVGADLQPQEHQDGQSLVPLLKGKTLVDRPLIWHYPHYGNQGGEPSSVLRVGDWKAIYYYEDERIELYDLANDLSEEKNLAQEHAERAAQMKQELMNVLEEMGARFPARDSLYDAGLEQQYLEQIRTELLPRLEERRLHFLSKNFNPENDWWGSVVTED